MVGSKSQPDPVGTRPRRRPAPGSLLDTGAGRWAARGGGTRAERSWGARPSSRGRAERPRQRPPPDIRGARRAGPGLRGRDQAVWAWPSRLWVGPGLRNHVGVATLRGVARRRGSARGGAVPARSERPGQPGQRLLPRPGRSGWQCRPPAPLDCSCGRGALAAPRAPFAWAWRGQGHLAWREGIACWALAVGAPSGPPCGPASAGRQVLWPWPWRRCRPSWAGCWSWDTLEQRLYGGQEAVRRGPRWRHGPPLLGESMQGAGAILGSRHLPSPTFPLSWPSQPLLVPLTPSALTPPGQRWTHWDPWVSDCPAPCCGFGCWAICEGIGLE